MLAIQTTNTQQNIDHLIQLQNGKRLLDTPDLTILCDNSSMIRTWNTTGWNLLSVDTEEKIAFFEASDSWLLAKLNLETGEWFTDDDPLFIRYSLNEDKKGLYVLEEQTDKRFYLK